MPRRLLFALLVVVACRGEQSATSPSTYAGAPVILISIDTLRADRLPVYGYRAIETPAIDAFARDAVVFDDAWSHCPMTLPSHVSMLTGLLPTEHGVRNNLGFAFDAAKHANLPSLLRARGYATGAAVSSYVLRGDTGLRATFDWYEDALDPRPGAAFAEYQRSGEITRTLAERWIDGVGEKPFFFFFHIYEPHVPYEPTYDAEIVSSDAIVGRFLAQLKARGIYDRALIVLTSDHGEGLGDHGEQQHSILLYTEAIRVPMIVKLPKSERAGTRIAEPAALVDILPTVTSLLGIDKPAAVQAPSLFALPKERELYAETIYPYVQLGWSDLRSLLGGGFHYIDAPKPELYDVRRDPREQTNVIDANRRVAAKLKASLERFPRASSDVGAIDPEVAAKLASLGYIGTARSRPDPRTLPNPRDHVAVLDDIQSAFQLANERKLSEAAAKLQAILKTHPRLVDVWVRLAEVQTENSDLDAAITAYKSAIASAGVFSADVMASLGHVYLQAGRLDEAAEAARLSKSPPLEVRVALARRDLVTAERTARALPPLPSNALLLSEVLVARGDLQGALAAVVDAESHAQRSGIARVQGLEMQRGDVLARMDRAADAMAALEKEIAAFPTNTLAYARLAVLQHLSGNRAAMEATLRRMLEVNPTPAARRIAERFGVR